MLIAHLPSGYLLAKSLPKNLLPGKISSNQMMVAALIGAMLPDIDMIYFLFIDMGKHSHHTYFTHWPLFWIAINAPTIVLLHFIGMAKWRNIAAVFFAGLMLHMVLDSVAAPIFWLRPFGLGEIELVNIPANYNNWILSFVFHWTIFLELAIWLVAIVVLYTREKIYSQIIANLPI